MPCASTVYHTAQPYIIDFYHTIQYNSFRSIREVRDMSDNKLLDLSVEFAISVVYLADSIKTPKSSYQVDQFARAGTSFGANIYEAQYAHSKADFIAKLEIALIESNETSYWLKLMFETGRIDEEQYKKTERLCGNIRRLLIASCSTSKGIVKNEHRTDTANA